MKRVILIGFACITFSSCSTGMFTTAPTQKVVMVKKALKNFNVVFIKEINTIIGMGVII
jgi:hypothetical protein